MYRVIHKKVLHKSEEKKHEKMKMTKQLDENLAHEQHQYGVCFCKKKIFPFMVYVADMAILMSDFDNFDHDQISWKLAQRQYFAFYFYCKIFLS